MPMTIYKLYSATAGDSVASLDVQLDGLITSILMLITVSGVDNKDDGGQAEVSFLSTNTFTASDVRGSLMMVSVLSGMLTSGMANMAENTNCSNLDIPVNAGERIHLHIADIGGPTGRYCHSYLYVLDKGTGRTAGRRR